MTQPRAVQKVKPFCGIIAAGPDALHPALKLLTDRLGSIERKSDVFPFDLTDYYEAEMGQGLVRQFVTFRDLVEPSFLADAKLQTIAIENELASASEDGPRRTVNLDPGYITPAKLVLASAKHRAHRIYLRDGIYAELTLTFHKTVCRTFDWTFQDFKSGRYNRFLLDVRQELIVKGPEAGSAD